MNGLEISVVIVIAVVAVLFVGGILASNHRDRALDHRFAGDVASADQALTAARASDRGWDRAALETAARLALETERPGIAFSRVDLVLVDDRPGVLADRAHYRALPEGGGDAVTVVLARGETGWDHESVA